MGANRALSYAHISDPDISGTQRVSETSGNISAFGDVGGTFYCRKRVHGAISVLRIQ